MKRTGDEYFDSEEFHDILAEYEEAVNTGMPVFMDADDLSEIAAYYQTLSEPERAEEAIVLALSLSPGAIGPITYRIHEALYNGDTAQAWEWLDQIIDKTEPNYIYDRAEILLAEGKVEEADEYFREEFRNVPPEEYQDFIVDAAGIFTDYGYHQKAMEWMFRGHQEDSPDYQELMGRTLFGLGKYKDSERVFNSLIDKNPFSARYWNALASAQFMEEDYSNAVQSSEYAIAIDPDDPDGLLAKANGLFRLNNFQEALRYYERYAEKIPDDEFAMLYQGMCLTNLGEIKEAIDILEKALKKGGEESPYFNDIIQELAFVYSEDGQTEYALTLLDHTNADTDPVQVELLKVHLLLGIKDLDRATEHVNRALAQTDDLSGTYLRVIISLYDNHYLEGAYELFGRYFDYVGEETTDGYAYMALCCYDMKKYDEFLAYLKKACQINPRECRTALQHLFPEELKPEDYYEYIKERMKQ